MILSDRFVFVHIPRTGGISISTALGTARNAQVNLTTLRHNYARFIRDREPYWNRLFRFSVIRSPWEIVASWWRLLKRELDFHYRRPNFDLREGPWISYLRRFSKDQDFGRYIERDILTGLIGIAQGGFWRTWCCGARGEDLGVRAVRFANLTAEWPEIAERCGRPGLALPHLNGTLRETVPWTAALIAAVGQYCADDVRRFGFQPPALQEHTP